MLTLTLTRTRTLTLTLTLTPTLTPDQAHWAALGSLARAGALPALRELRISGCDTGDEGVALLAAGLRERGRLPALRCLYVNAAQVGHG